jgi:hypothetical protein
MKMIGCDLPAAQQAIAMLDCKTGEIVEKTLKVEGRCDAAASSDVAPDASRCRARHRVGDQGVSGRSGAMHAIRWQVTWG